MSHVTMSAERNEKHVRGISRAAAHKLSAVYGRYTVSWQEL
jgi:hypothetical protein